MPKPSGLINELEREICGRVREIRKRASLSQKEFANVLGLTRAQVAALDMTWYPLRYGAADRLCQRFNICQRWLATGLDPARGYVEIRPEIAIGIGARELFSAAYERNIAHSVKLAVRANEELERALASDPQAADKIRENQLYNLALMWFSRIPPHLYQAYFGALMAASSEFYQKHKREIPLQSQVRIVENNDKKDLTQSASVVKYAPVKATFPSFLARLNRATEETGKKSQLAEYLGAPAASVSRWLSGQREPGGEITLKMLRWVELQERTTK